MVDESQGPWRFMTPGERRLVKFITIFLYPWILYDKLRGRHDK